MREYEPCRLLDGVPAGCPGRPLAGRVRTMRQLLPESALDASYDGGPTDEAEAFCAGTTTLCGRGRGGHQGHLRALPVDLWTGHSSAVAGWGGTSAEPWQDAGWGQLVARGK